MTMELTPWSSSAISFVFTATRETDEEEQG